MITILMAAYNGEKYIAQQIESILTQSEPNWKLVIQDDCSSDSTLKIAKCFAEKFPDKITVHERAKNSGSAANNFFSMMRYAGDNYVMFSDNDDVWRPDKICSSLLKMEEMERNFGAGVPLLVHTDLKVVDQDLREISGSMFKMQSLNSKRDGLNHLLSQNIVTGCTMMINQALINMFTAEGIPEHAVMHDWWFALIAAAFGKIGFVSEPTILYRQHGNNQVGAKNAGNISYNIKRFMDAANIKKALNGTYEQAEEFKNKFSFKLNVQNNNIINDYISIPDRKKIDRIKVIYVDDFWKTGTFRRIGQIWFS